MQDSTFVHDLWSSNRVPELTYVVDRVPIEFPNFFK